MPLAWRLVERAGDESVIAVDGAFGAPGLELSHWPGNRTPAHLRHDLSTGAALAFARLPAAERARLAYGARAVVNNHYDTDGVLAMWVVLHPDRAVELERPLLDAAAAGDFFHVPSRHAFALDALIGRLADPEESPIQDRVAGLRDEARHRRALEFALLHLEEWLSQPLDGPAWAPFLAWIESPLARLDADLADLAAATRTDLPALDLVHFVAESPIAPGRHALFHAAGRDRALVSARHGDEWTHRLVVGTRSWFDLESAPPPPRPDLAAARDALAEREPPRGAAAWRAEETESPSPELWFGTADHPRFAEHSNALIPSLTPPEVVREALATAAR